MQVLPLFKKVQICLIPNKQLVTAIPHVDRCGIDLIAVAEMDAVEVTAKHYRHGIRRTIRHACVHHPLLMGVLQTTRYVGSPHDAIRTSQSRGVY